MSKKTIENINQEIHTPRLILSPKCNNICIFDDDGMNEFIKDNDRRFKFFISIKSGDIVGYVMLEPFPKSRNKEMNVAYYIKPEFRRQYYAEEATLYLIEFAIDRKLRYIGSNNKEITLKPLTFWGCVNCKNIASKKILKRLGFVFRKKWKKLDGFYSWYLLTLNRYYEVYAALIMKKFDFLSRELDNIMGEKI